MIIEPIWEVYKPYQDFQLSALTRPPVGIIARYLIRLVPERTTRRYFAAMTKDHPKKTAARTLAA